jgi:hypothetical protein
MQQKQPTSATGVGFEKRQSRPRKTCHMIVKGGKSSIDRATEDTHIGIWKVEMPPAVDRITGDRAC